LDQERKDYAQAGTKCTVKKNVVQGFCNGSGLPVIFTTVIVPRSRSFEQALRILYGLALEGATDAKGQPKSLVTLAVISKMSDLHLAGALRLFTPLFGMLNRRAEKKGIPEALIKRYCS
jgi:hypothetical protein